MEPHQFFTRERTDPELEVHSVDFEERHSKPRWMEHVTEAKGKIKEKTKVADFNIPSIQPHRKNQKPTNDYGYEETVSEEFKEENKSHKSDLGCQYTFSDDEDSILHDKEGISYSIYDSIRAIRKEALKIDAVLAVDQVDRLQEEMKQLRSELRRQNVETAELNALMQMKDDQIGTLELERDLYKADTNKLANDLECCLMKLRRVGGTFSPIAIGYGQSETVLTSRDDNTLHMKEASLNPPKLITADDTSDTSDPVSQMDQSTSPLLSPSCVESPTGTSLTTATTGIISCGNTPTSHSTHEKKLSDPPNVLPILEKPRLVSNSKPRRRPQEPEILHDDINQKPTTSTQQMRKKVLLFSFCRPQNKGRSILKPTPELPKKKNHSSKPQTFSNMNSLETAQLACGMLQEQVQEMSQRAQSSVKTSEDLRRRIASVHFNYERQIHQLEARMMEVCAERSKIEFEKNRKTPQIVQEERVANQESKVHKPNTHISSAKKSRVVKFNV